MEIRLSNLRLCCNWKKLQRIPDPGLIGFLLLYLSFHSGFIYSPIRCPQLATVEGEEDAGDPAWRWSGIGWEEMANGRCDIYVFQRTL